MKFKVLTVKKNNNAKYDWFGMELKPSQNYQYIGELSNKLEYQDEYKYADFYRNGDFAEVEIDEEEYINSTNNVQITPELSCKFYTKGSDLYLHIDTEFADYYEFSINELGELIIKNKMI